MSKKELKLQNKDLDMNVIDILTLLDPSETNKYTPFLLKMLRKEMDRPKLRKLRGASKAASNVIEDYLVNFLLDFMGRENFEHVKNFHNHLENNRISEDRRDINQYDSWGDLEKEVGLATFRAQQKSLEKEVLKVLETDEWVAIRPLTLESSLAYGASTKWCTAMKNNSEYFYRYSRNGVLIYVINKKDGDKYGLFFDHNNGEFSIWNAPDRRIDSVETTIPSDMMKRLYMIAKTEKRNYDYFSETEKRRMDGKELKSVTAAPRNEDYGQILEAPRDVEMTVYRYQEDPVVDMEMADLDVEMMAEECYDEVATEEVGYDEPMTERDPWENLEQFRTQVLHR